MAVLLSRTVVVPVWVGVFVLIAALAPPSGTMTRMVTLLGIALVASTLVALASSGCRALVRRARRRHGPIVEVLPAVDDDPWPRD